jgi:hypothetical protein
MNVIQGVCLKGNWLYMTKNGRKTRENQAEATPKKKRTLNPLLLALQTLR